MRTISENSSYRVGVYGPRNACQRVSDAGYAVTSFVSDMSSGFPGNLGYPPPTNWAFDQISTITVGSGSGSIEIDNDIASGRDTAQGDFAPGTPVENDLDADFDKAAYRSAMLADVQKYLTSIGVPKTGGEGVVNGDNVTSTPSPTKRSRPACATTAAPAGGRSSPGWPSRHATTA